MKKSCFFANLTDGGLFGGFAVLNMTFGDCPATLGILNEENLDIIIGLVDAKTIPPAVGSRTTSWMVGFRNILADKRVTAETLSDFSGSASGTLGCSTTGGMG